MTRFFGITAACCGLGLTLTGCLKKDTNICSVTQVEPALTATGPRTIAVNQTASFVVSYIPQSTCGTFQSFAEQVGSGTNFTPVNVGVRVNYSSCDCPASTTIVQSTYTFKPTQAGTYYLNFAAATSTGYITDTLVAR